MAVFLTRKAIKKLKEKQFMGDLEELNSESGDLKYLAVADVKVDKEAGIGLFGRPSFLLMGKSWLLDKLGRNHRVLAVVQTEDGTVLFLVLQPSEMDEEEPEISKEQIDAGFAAGRGFSVITSTNMDIVYSDPAGAPDAFLVKPHPTRMVVREKFLLTLNPEEGNEKKQAAAAATRTYLSSVAIQE
eukprot:scaffold26047_cov55-Attheya_sp.AAC.10